MRNTGVGGPMCINYREQFPEAPLPQRQHGTPAQPDAGRGVVHLVHVAKSLQDPILVERAPRTNRDAVVEVSGKENLCFSL